MKSDDEERGREVKCDRRFGEIHTLKVVLN